MILYCDAFSGKMQSRIRENILKGVMNMKIVKYSIALLCINMLYSGAITVDKREACRDWKVVKDLLQKSYIQQAEKFIVSPEFKGSSFVDETNGTLLNLLAAFDLDNAALKVLKDEHINMKSGCYSSTPLCIAAQYGSMKMVKLLLEKGADVTICCKEDILPINFAAAFGHLSIVKMLLEKDSETINGKSRSPLHSAAKRNQKEVIEYLLSKGADKCKKDIKGKTPLNYATDIEVIQLLVSPIKQDGSFSAQVRGRIRALALKWTA